LGSGAIKGSLTTVLNIATCSSLFPNQQERLDIEEKYTSLQEEAQGKTKKLKKVWTMLMAAKSEVRNTRSGRSELISVFAKQTTLLWLVFSSSLFICYIHFA
jgi:hypothetical protein